MNYPVPDFGVDEDIVSSLHNEKLGSKMVNHDW